MKKTLLPVVACLGLGLALAACGGGVDSEERAESAATVWEKYGDMAPDARDPELAELAKDEGKLTFYAGWTYAEELSKAFTAKYGIDVETYHADNETVEQRIDQELDANKSKVDVLELEFLPATQFDEDGFWYDDWKPNTNGQDQPSDGWFTIRYVAYVVGWNTDKVPAGEEPTSFEDLTDPKWKGQIGMELDDVNWYVGLTKYYTEQGKSEDEIHDLLMGIAKNSRQGKGHTGMATSLGAGEYGILASAYNQSIDLAAAEGAPVAWKTADGKAVEPIILVPEGLGLAKDAINPASAMLFADFVASEEGQKIVQQYDGVPAMENLSPVADFETISIAPAPEELLTSRKFQDEYQEILAATGS